MQVCPVDYIETNSTPRYVQTDTEGPAALEEAQHHSAIKTSVQTIYWLTKINFIPKSNALVFKLDATAVTEYVILYSRLSSMM